ncbi:amidohydrolase [Horticoccus luteus]|uniref:Amidohydrolase n=1 Tax=Horticoccus luteus TaxID=2862869 RepID=A0A8F9TXS5_9BACT|nr:amidohydrolase family protein [Horticoccus luteus]QYM80188.1 amidohydrolase [Horticoccus luteus]
MSIVDAHVHLYPPEVNGGPGAWAAARGEAQWSRLATRQRKDGRFVQTFPGVDALLRQMDADGVGRAVLLGWYWEKPETCARQNAFYAECVAAHPDRLAAFATVHPGAGEDSAVAEVRRAHEAGLSGVGELSPHSQGHGLDDAAFRATLEFAGEWGMPVTLHVTDPDARAYPGKVETPLEDFVRLAREHPRTTFILAHWGGLLPLRMPEARTLANVYYDTAASPLLYGEDVWRRFLDVVPAERVLFGSDFPINVYPRIDESPNFARLVAEAHRSGATALELAQVMGSSARRLLEGAVRKNEPYTGHGA